MIDFTDIIGHEDIIRHFKSSIELAGDLPRVELFARQKAPGWDVWGNEVDSDLSLTPQETVSETR